jgi:hypothetical protein
MNSTESGIMKVLRAVGNGIMWVFRDEEKVYGERKGQQDTTGPQRAVDVEKKEEEKEKEEYDPWDEIRNMRMTFWFGSWVTRKFRPIGEDKLKAKLAELEKKRQEEAKEEKEGEEL